MILEVTRVANATERDVTELSTSSQLGHAGSRIIYAVYPGAVSDVRALLTRRQDILKRPRNKASRILGVVGGSFLTAVMSAIMLLLLTLFITRTIPAWLYDDQLVFATILLVVVVLIGMCSLAASSGIKRDTRKLILSIDDDIKQLCIEFGDISLFRVGNAIFHDDQLAWDVANLSQALDREVKRRSELFEARDVLDRVRIPSASVRSDIVTLRQKIDLTRSSESELADRLAEMLDS